MNAQPAIAAALRELLPPAITLHQTWIAPDRFELRAEEAVAVAQAVPQRRMEFAAGRHCARAALREAFGSVASLTVSPQRLPQWPPGAVGSITHDAHWCAAAVAPRSEFVGLGIDIEQVARFTPDLQRSVATAGEIARWLKGHSALEQQRNLARLFSAKEACFKAHFPITQAWLDFTDAEVALPSSHLGSFSLRLLKAAGHFPAGHVFEGGTAWAAERVCAAVCLQR